MRRSSSPLSWPFLLSVLVAAATGDYRVEIRLDQYQNPFHLRADGTCCNVRRQHCTSCRNRFTFCILQFDDLSGYESSSLCGSQPHYATGVVRGGASVFAHNLDNLSFAEKGYIDKQSHICNPLVFTGNGSWPGEFQLVVKITNWKSPFHEELVDLIAEDWELPIGEEFRQRRLSGFKLHSILTVSARVACTQGVLCHNCTQVCENSLSEGKPIQDDRNADRNRSHGGGKFGAGASRPGNEDYRTGGDGDDEMSDSTPPHPRNGSKTAVGNTSSEDALRGTLDETAGNDTNLQNNQLQLAIGLSVTGILLIILLLIAIIVVCAFLQWRRRKKKGAYDFRGERRPFLQHRSSDNTVGHAGSYTGLPVDEESTEEDSTQQNRLRGSNLYQPLPQAALESERSQHQPRTGQVQNPGARVSLAWSTPLSSEYSIIRRQDLDRSLSPAQSLEDIPEEDEEDSDTGEGIHAGYSVIRREDIDAAYVSDGSASDGGTGEGQAREELQDANRHLKSAEMGGEDTAGLRGQSIGENSSGDGERGKKPSDSGDSGKDTDRGCEEEDARVDWSGRPRMPTPPQN